MPKPLASRIDPAATEWRKPKLQVGSPERSVLAVVFLNELGYFKARSSTEGLPVRLQQKTGGLRKRLSTLGFAIQKTRKNIN